MARLGRTFPARAHLQPLRFSTGAVSTSVTQVAAILTTAGGTQAVSATVSASIAQVAATLTTTGGTQVVASSNIVGIAQVSANLTATGGTQAVSTVNNSSIAQVAATLTTTGGTQVVVTTQSASIAQVAATVTATGGTQVVTAVRNVSIAQLAATVTATGGTQVVVAHTTSLQNNIISYYKLDDATGSTALDSLGTNNGTWQGTLGSQWGTGKINGDGVFNGTDNYILVGDKPTLSFGTGNFTLSAWIKTTAAARQTIINKYQYTGTSVESGYYIDMLASGAIRTVYETTNANLANTDSAITINDGNWHQVTVTRPSTTGAIQLYIDGALDTGATNPFSAGTPGNIDNTIPFAIGQSISTSLSITNWSGQIDEVGVWGRSLTSAEVAQLYNSGFGQQYPFGSLRISQLAATLTASGGTQTTNVTSNAAITQVAATLTTTGGTQTVTTVNNASITQVAATLTTTGGTQAVATQRFVSLAQVAATITATGGTQVVVAKIATSVTQVAATLTTTTGTQVVAAVRNVSIAQVAATLTVSGGTQVIASGTNIFITQVAGTITATGGTPSLATQIATAIDQRAATLAANGGTPDIRAITPPNFLPLTITLDSTGSGLAINDNDNSSNLFTPSYSVSESGETNSSNINTGVTIGNIDTP